MVLRRKKLSGKKAKGDWILNNKLKILLPLVVMLIIFNLALGQEKSDTSSKDVKAVKVLIYNGSDTSSNCVLMIESCMEKSNNHNITPYVKFVYNTSEVINNKTLSGYDVLILPGTSEKYDYMDSENIDVDAVKSFVASGKGFIGICAGAYSGAEYTEGWYEGWGLAPNVVNEHALDTGNLTVQITSAGDDLFGYGGTKVMSHVNGPAMYSSDNKTVTFATYADNNTDYEGYAAIVGDYYGKGRTVLSGVHPELEPQHPEILAYLVLWAYNGTDNITSIIGDDTSASTS